MKKTLFALLTIPFIVLANQNFCRTDGTSLTYAPDGLMVPYAVTNYEWHIDESVDPPREWCDTNVLWKTKLTLAPKAVDYLACGWLKNGVLPPSPPSGMMVASVRYEGRGGAVVAIYEYVEAQRAPRVFSRLKLYGAIAGLGAWDKVKAWLESKELNGMNGWVAFQLAQDLSEDHPLYKVLAEEGRVLLGLTEEQFDAIMDGCILEN